MGRGTKRDRKRYWEGGESGRLLEITENLPGGIDRVPPPPQTKILATPLEGGRQIGNDVVMEGGWKRGGLHYAM